MYLFKKSLTNLKLLRIALIVLVFVLNILILPAQTYAQAGQAACGSFDINNPSIIHIICPFIRLLNVFLWTSGFVFVIMIFIGTYKYATSMGDPKATLGGNLTLTYGVFGFLIVVGSITALTIVSNVFGLTVNPTGFGGALQSALCELIRNDGGRMPIVSGVPGCN